MSRWSAVALALVAAAFLAHLWVVRAHAVDLPLLDEWELLGPGALPSGLSARWLFATHNEHRVVLTKLQAWLLLQANGWDNVTFVTSTFLLFGALLVALGAWLARGGLPLVVVCAFGLLLLSPIAAQNHAWGFQSQVHLPLLGLVLAATGLFSRAGSRAGVAARASGLCALVIGAFCFASGVVYGVTLLLVFALHRALVAGHLPEAERRPARLETAGLLFVGTGALALWSIGWPGSGLTPTWPTSWRFWDVLLNLVSLGFGFKTRSAALGALCLALVLAPLAGLASRARRDDPRDPRVWELAAVTGALLAGLAGVALSRGIWGPSYAKTSRYAELALPLVPVAALCWWRLLEARPRARAAAVALAWALPAVGLADDWTRDTYRAIEASKREAVVVIAARRPGEPLRCLRVYGGDLEERVEAARRLGVSFTRALPR